MSIVKEIIGYNMFFEIFLVLLLQQKKNAIVERRVNVTSSTLSCGHFSEHMLDT